MRIESTNLSYMKVPDNAGRINNGAAKQAEKAVNRSNRVEKSSGISQPVKTKPVETTAASGRAAGTKLSKYLSTEEREMLNGLFPPAGGNFGVNAYRQRQSSELEATLGRQIDLTS